MAGLLSGIVTLSLLIACSVAGLIGIVEGIVTGDFVHFGLGLAGISATLLVAPWGPASPERA